MMKRKLITILLSIMLIASICTVVASAQTGDNPDRPISFSMQVGGSIEPFTYDYNFDSAKGILRAKYNNFLFKELGVQVFHTVNSHYGVVVCGKNSNSTAIASSGEWTKLAEVRTGTDQTTGTVTAFY